MILTTGDLENVPVIMTIALAQDADWFVEITGAGTTLTGRLAYADWSTVVVDMVEMGTWLDLGHNVEMPWDLVERVNVP